MRMGVALGGGGYAVQHFAIVVSLRNDAAAMQLVGRRWAAGYSVGAEQERCAALTRRLHYPLGLLPPDVPSSLAWNPSGHCQ